MSNGTGTITVFYPQDGLEALQAMDTDQNAGVVQAECADCGVQLVINRSAYDPEGETLCRFCEVARRDAQREPWSLDVLERDLNQMSFPALLALGMVSSARRSLAGLCKELRTHNPRIIVAACEVLFWTLHAVRAGKLTRTDAEVVLIDTANMVYLLADELVICASIILHLRAGSMADRWPLVERGAISAWIQTRVYHAQEEQLRGVSGGFSPYDPRFSMLQAAVTDEENVS